MSERSQTLGWQEARGVSGAVVLARAVGGDALGRLEQVLASSRLPQLGLAAAVQRGLEVSREGGAGALPGFSADLQALGRALAGDVAVQGLLEEWRTALRLRSSLSVERIAFGCLAQWLTSRSGSERVTRSSTTSERRGADVDPSEPALVESHADHHPVTQQRGRPSPPSAVTATERAAIEMGSTGSSDSASPAHGEAIVTEFNRRFTADLLCPPGEEESLTLSD